MKKIGDIDKRLKVENDLNKNNIVFYDVKEEPFQIYGIALKDNDNIYKRLPAETAENVSENVSILATHTAGVRVRFSTNSSYIAIKAKIPPFSIMSHMTPLGQAGFDLYFDKDEKSYYIGAFLPPASNTETVDSFESVINFGENKLRNYTINFPLYNGVNELLIGIESTAEISSGAAYSKMAPIAYYGSSITQGGCASRPGNSYQSIISRKNNIDYINLGFSGGALGEDAMINYLSNLDMSVFVCDYDHNQPTAEELEKSHSKLYHAVRNKKPDIPIIFISRPNFNPSFIDDIKCRNVVYQTYMHGIDSGDNHIYFIDGYSLFDDENRDCSTVDGCHPNDFGFVHMADVIGAAIKVALSYTH